MRSRTVRPIRRRESEERQSRKKSIHSMDDTQPLRPAGQRRSGVSTDTVPMRPVRVRPAYAGYQKVIDRRRQVLRTPRPTSEKGAGKRQHHAKAGKRSGLTALLAGRGRAAAREQYFDFDLLLVIIFLMCFGLVMLYSTSAYEAQVDFGNDMYYFSKQALIGVLGFIAMFIVSKIDYHLYGAFALEIYIFSMIMMALVKTPLGLTLNGARRWIQLPGNLTLQPAEITKIAVILFISYELCRLGRKAYTMEGIIRVLVFGAVASGGVLFLTDNLSTAIIVMAITCILIFVIHPKTKPFLMIIGIGAAVAAVGIAILSVTAANSDNFRLQRILSWLNPEATADTGSFQVMQGLYAIGSGGFFGKGLGNSTQKLGVIPEAQNDMILVVICEELGVFGAIIILVLFGILLYRLMFIAKNAPDLYGSLIASGIFAHIALQVILNIGVVTGLLPTTGITLPFISYGGTAIVFLLAEMGIALGISRRIRLEGE
ncbi:FtsW/RodA/SpoVE family cell cycle protein [Clostridium sp. Marseille-P3244]|uniref:FtsW/RodA/SpoVE family cell cycle protein n=1 Tax=Clostridium sp. Marseille-P3244 TaxID=1871020 RepID=UPI0009F91DB4|nr:putative peptidoglycan glycosyltransferase FtsW [Clostridium sp. Marseille-P3244]